MPAYRRWSHHILMQRSTRMLVAYADLRRQSRYMSAVDFLINVTQNRRREITGFFCGEVIAAHDAGCAFAKQTAMVACPHGFPIVVTSNSGFPLDQNLYQTVKGMSAAAQVVTEGGLIIAAAECGDGFRVRVERK